MSSWKVHSAVGIFCTAVMLLIFSYFKMTNFFVIMVSFLISFVYSQAPDLDTQASKIRWILTVAGTGTAFVFLVFFNNTKIAIILIGIVIIIWTMGLIKHFGHRGVTHTILAGILTSCLLLFFSWQYAVIAFINYMSHLIMDYK